MLTRIEQQREDTAALNASEVMVGRYREGLAECIEREDALKKSYVALDKKRIKGNAVQNTLLVVCGGFIALQNMDAIVAWVSDLF